MAMISGEKENAGLTKAMASVLTEVSAKLAKVAEQLETTEAELHEMRTLARRYLKEGKKRKPVQATVLAGAVLYITLHHKVLGFRDVAVRVNSPKSYAAIGKLCNDMRQQFKTKIAPLRAKELVGLLLETLNIEPRNELRELAAQIAGVLGDEEVHEGSLRAGVAAASVLLAARAHNIKLSQKDVASASKLSSSIIGSRLTDLQDIFIRLARVHNLHYTISRENVHHVIMRILKKQKEAEEKTKEELITEVNPQQAASEPVSLIAGKRKRNDQQQPQQEWYSLLDGNEEPSAPQEKRLRVEVKLCDEREKEEKEGDTTDDEDEANQQ